MADPREQQTGADSNMSTGMREQHITPESHDYASRGGAGLGHDDRPSGSLETPQAMTGSSTLTQGGGAGTAGTETAAPLAATGERTFAQTSEAVQAVSDGETRHHHGDDDHEDAAERREH